MKEKSTRIRVTKMNEYIKNFGHNIKSEDLKDNTNNNNNNKFIQKKGPRDKPYPVGRRDDRSKDVGTEDGNWTTIWDRDSGHTS